MKSLCSVLTPFCILLVVTGFIVSGSYAQDVLTWHNDMGRTAWQQAETTLTPGNVANNFGHVFSS